VMGLKLLQFAKFRVGGPPTDCVIEMRRKGRLRFEK